MFKLKTVIRRRSNIFIWPAKN